MKDRNLWVFDLETYPNFFLAVFFNVDTKEWKTFEISDRLNQIERLRIFLYSNNLKLIGFNNINFDYPILHHTILKHTNWSSESIYKIVKEIINSKYSAIWDNETKIPQLDLYKIWHYDNKNKATSLKWLEFAMRSRDVRDLPYPVGTYLNDEEKEDVISYCKHDVSQTYKFYIKSSKHIELRKFYTSHENINLMNASEIKMSKEIFAKYLSKEMNIRVSNVKKLRTFRKRVDIKDLIFDYIKFNDPINQKTLEKFKNSIWINSKNEEDQQISFSVNYKNVIREYAEGGLHSFGESKIYESNDDYVLIDVDFASFYPHISFKNNLHPKHIPSKVFNEIYEGFYKERKNYPKSDPRNYVLKIILNGSYGLSKDVYSFLYDPYWQLAITINGQLLLTKLTELIYEKCNKEIKMVFENTDGAMYFSHRDNISSINDACAEMEKICSIPLEIQQCKKVIARDVNNYINIIDDKTVKYKGVFEINRDYHKNHSKRIVPLALANYFINNIEPQETIYNHLDKVEYNLPMDKKANSNIEEDKDNYQCYGIYDFCLGAKMKGDNKLYKRVIKGTTIEDLLLPNMTRYFISNSGNQLIKKLPPLEKNYLTETDKFKNKYDPNQLNIFDEIEDVKIDPEDRETNIEAGWLCTVFNLYKKENYDINYNYYINECNKIISIF